MQKPYDKDKNNNIFLLTCKNKAENPHRDISFTCLPLEKTQDDNQNASLLKSPNFASAANNKNDAYYFNGYVYVAYHGDGDAEVGDEQHAHTSGVVYYDSSNQDKEFAPGFFIELF